MEKDNKTMLKRNQKKYTKPSIKGSADGNQLWPVSVAAAKAVGSAVGIAYGLFGRKGFDNDKKSINRDVE